MKLRELLADGRAIGVALLLAAVGLVVNLVADVAAGPALAAAAAVGAVGYTVHVVTAWLGASSRRRTERPPRSSRPVPADVRPWLRRAGNAADELDAKRSAGTNPTVVRALADAASYARTAVDTLHERAQAVAVIDDGAGTDVTELRREQQRLRREAEASDIDSIRAAKTASARAMEERAVSRERLTELRGVLLATFESTVLRMEAAAAHATLVVSFQVASDASDSPVHLTSLADELEAVQEGLDTLDDLARRLLAAED